MEERKLTCIGCPMGCQLQVIIKDGIVEKVTGNTCKRGADYGKKEVTDPTRIVTSTVRVQGGTLPVGACARRQSQALACQRACRALAFRVSVGEGTKAPAHAVLELAESG